MSVLDLLSDGERKAACIFALGLGAVAIWMLVLIFDPFAVDRGRCLRSHSERRPARVQMIMAGKVLVPINRPAHDVTVCDVWEFPEGKP